MSNAARKARKREQRDAGQKYQHPTREGVPYGRSKQPNIAHSLPSRQQLEMTAAMVEAARDGLGWRW